LAIKKDSLDKDILKEDRSGQPTVLVVDDDLSLQNLFKVFLKKIGFSRVVVGTVKEAIAALEKQSSICLFLDLKLPDGPADDVYEAAKEMIPNFHCRDHRISGQRYAQPDPRERVPSLS
jgi:CheY-like chemotaxis protein